MEYVSFVHDKFWEAWGVGKSGEVRVRYGRNGTDGTVIIKNWSYVSKKGREKISNGYVEKSSERTRITPEPDTPPSFTLNEKKEVVPKKVVESKVPKKTEEKKITEKNVKKTMKELMEDRKKTSLW